MVSLNELRHYKAQIEAIAAAHKANNIRVFGSVARGDTHANSDIDILVSFLPDANLYDLSALHAELNAHLPYPVDVISDEALKPRFYRTIQDDITPL